MNFLKQNWFKLIIALSILIGMSSLVNYYFLYLPDKELANQDNKCREYGQNQYDDEYNEIAMVTRIYGYSKSLKTCLMESSTIFTKDNSVRYRVDDIYKNEELFFYTSWCSESSGSSSVVDCLTLQEYINKKSKMFNK